MKRFIGSIFVAALLTGVVCAQQPQNNNNAAAENQQLEQTGGLTPELQLYLQEMRRYEDPQQVVKRNAAQRAAQRRSRLASMKWFGLSNQRPRASVTPFMGTYSPAWVGNSWNPYHWSGVGYPHTTVRLEIVPDRYRY